MPAIAEAGEVRRDAVYTMAEFTARTGLKRDAIRTARQNGLVVDYRHGRAFVRGDAWLDYLERQAEQDA